MATVRLRDDSSIWLARFVDAEGKKRERSTGETRRREAQKIADAYEAAAQRKMTIAHVQRTLRELMADATGAIIPGLTLADYFERWLRNRRVEVAPSTFRYLETSSRHFLEWASSNLPRQSRTELALVTAADIDAYRAFRLERVTPTTVNQEVKFLRGVFEAARREAVVVESPLSSLGRIRHHVPSETRPFTMDEVRQLLSAADDEWRSMILFGLYTGQRLGDIARMDWRAVDLQRGELAFRMGKTGKRMLVPLAIPLLTQLASVSALERLGPVHPRAAAKLARLGKTSCLSLEFHRLLVRTKILPPRDHERVNEAGISRHRRCEVSFHSFRHTATSMLRDAGAPVGVAMELIGHCSPAVHRHYAHLGTDTLRRAVSLLPTL